MRAMFFLMASALAPVCGICGISIGVPVVLNSESFSRLPAVGCWARAGWARSAVAARLKDKIFIVSSRIVQPFLDCHADTPDRNAFGAPPPYDDPHLARPPLDQRRIGRLHVGAAPAPACH